MKKLLLAAFWLPLMALAQTYPSPTYNNVTVLGTLTGKVNSTGSTITNATITGGTISGLSSPLPVASGGTNSASASGTALDNIAGFAGTGFMSRTGAGAYSFTASTGSGSVVQATSPTISSPTITGALTATGLVTTADLATQAANTVLANGTGSSASPTAFAMPGCSSATNALQWTSGTGFACNSAINAATLGGATFAAPGAIGSTTASTGAFTTLSTNGTATINNSSGNSLIVNSTSGNGIVINGASNSGGATVVLEGNGATTPNKYLRVLNGAFQVINSANSAIPMSMDDAGDVTFTGSITAEGTPATFGSSLKPLTTPGQISTTATSTINTNTITVTSASGLVAGMGIYATFMPTSCQTPAAAFVNPYITNISGTTITMSCNATATNGTPVAVNFGTANRWDQNSTLTANDIGTQTLKVGRAAGNGAGDITGNTASWLDQVSAGLDYRTTAAAQIIALPTAGGALVTASRSSDATGGASALPISSFLNLDSWGNTGYGAENVYLQDNLAAATAGHSQPHIQMEQSVNSLWGSPPAEDPYSINQVNQTILHRYDCGTGQSSTSGMSGCTTAIDIVTNPENFQNGIVFGNGAIAVNSGFGNGISFPQSVGMIWYSASNTFSAEISSNTSNTINFQFPSTNGAGVKLNGVLTTSTISPSVNSGFGSGASVSASNGTAAFIVHVGTSPGATGVLNMPSGATNGWICDGFDASQNNATQFYMRQTAGTTSTVTFTMFASSGSASSFVAGDSLAIKCTGY